ncbi:MAG TPA: lipopolysaccharide biosynthesis protein [Blastococcus sp.]|jgi:O-antigen/teichoic acid export membrane protein|nr:lipopolysaccharide biosynthesis protein [Blastococcus sp.]
MSEFPVATDTTRLARHGALYTVGVVAQGIATLVVIPFVTRLLGPAEYGHVAVGLSIIQIGAVFAVAGLPVAITRAYFDPGDGPLRARAMLGFVVGMGLVVTAAALLLQPVLGDVVSLSVAAVGAMTLVVSGQAVLRAQGRPFVFMITAIGSTAGAHLVGLGAASLHRTASAYLAGYLVGAGLTAVLAMAITPPVLPWRVHAAMREGITIALPVLPHTAAILIINAADPLIISRLLGESQAGRYQVAMMLGIAPLAVLSGINNAWSPAIMGAPEEDRWSFLARTTRPIMWVATVCTLGLALLAPLAVHVLAPASFGYDAMTQLVQVIALCAPLQVIYLGAASVIFNQKRTTPLAFSTPLAAAVFVGLSIPLVHILGLLGMSVAKVVGFAALSLATVVAAGRVADVPWKASRWVPIIGTALVAVVALQFVPSSAEAIWLQAGAAVVLGLAFLGTVARLGLPRGAPAGPDRRQARSSAPISWRPASVIDPDSEG